jgi:hypothetical protein
MEVTTPYFVSEVSIEVIASELDPNLAIKYEKAAQ